MINFNIIRVFDSHYFCHVAYIYRPRLAVTRKATPIEKVVLFFYIDQYLQYRKKSTLFCNTVTHNYLKRFIRSVHFNCGRDCNTRPTDGKIHSPSSSPRFFLPTS